MAARIILVRHGPSSHAHSAGAIDRAAVVKWLDSYDAAGIQDGSRPPASLLRAAADAKHIVASDLPRALASAERLAEGRPITVSDLLRETPLAVPHWPKRLPLGAWALLIHLGWVDGMVRGTHPDEPQRVRAASAADMVAALVEDGSTAIVVTHAVFRRLLARQLLARGWVGVGRVSGYRHWSSWTFTGPP